MADVTTIVKKGGTFQRTVMILMAGVEVTFTRAWLDTGELVMIAEIEKDNPDHDRVINQAIAVGKSFKVPNRAPKVAAWDTGAPLPSPAAPAIGKELTPKDIAVRNGWAPETLEGAGMGEDWGETGGRSLVSGLTMAEMALCPPPTDWDRAKQYPWDVLGWRGPSVGWKPPVSMPSKVKPTESIEPAVSPPPEPEPDLEIPVDDEEDEPTPIPEDDALEDYGTAEEQEAAIELVGELFTGDVAPSRNKVAYHLRKHELPTLGSKETFEALLRAAKP